MSVEKTKEEKFRATIQTDLPPWEYQNRVKFRYSAADQLEMIDHSTEFTKAQCIDIVDVFTKYGCRLPIFLSDCGRTKAWYWTMEFPKAYVSFPVNEDGTEILPPIHVLDSMMNVSKNRITILKLNLTQI